MINANTLKLLRYRDLVALGVVFNRTTLQRWLAWQLFPQPIRIGPNTVAWREADVLRWLDERAAGSEPDSPEAA